ncbi:two-component sensor histidine kinase [Agromyces rhizosphaerae]|uniref:Signal transduction histidine-protein kinase/phosphatase MprB n=1 Tax=Agromyces rhizosphaerae TaxID=88374 RepID=A0A9W6CX43_9MICO|nr:HAMP domain-containing sensor histidine kinase [Agromyces rhizosphaerae]GLI28212.1 two-component sensor histidine kinase [Agromyces rhizosphaerae]
MIPLPDLLAIVGIAGVAALLVGAIGLLVLIAARRASIMLQVVIVVLSTVLAVGAGTIAVANAMYLSEHDLLVTGWVVVVAGVVALGVGAVLGRILVGNTRRLREIARAVGDGQTVQPDGREGTEFAALADELADASRRLADSRAEVARIDQSRRELISWISHDLRTPLAGLRAMAEALEDGMVDDPARYHAQMRVQVDRVSSMVDDLFELSRIQSGALALEMEQVSLFDLVSDAVAELLPLARARDVTIVESRAGDLTVTGDARELSRVVGNLLMNAIQHSPPGSRIEVTARETGDAHVALSVTDAGGGIPEEDLAKVFRAGWRGTPSRSPSEAPADPIAAGAGLGLAIVQGIVDAHAGGVSVRNVPGGCRFDVTLPRVGAPA